MPAPTATLRNRVEAALGSIPEEAGALIVRWRADTDGDHFDVLARREPLDPHDPAGCTLVVLDGPRATKPSGEARQDRVAVTDGYDKGKSLGSR